MSTPNETRDSLQISLTAEAADLPYRAAIEARRRNVQRQRNRRRFTVASSVLLLAAFTWLASPWRGTSHPSTGGSHSIAESHTSHVTLKPAHPPDSTSAGSISYGSHDDPGRYVNQPLPTGLNPEQLALVKAAGDLPMLLVRDSSGKVTRIHVIER